MSESFAEQLSRVEQMADDDGETWDLSENDQAALKAVLAQLAQVVQERDELREIVAPWRCSLLCSICGGHLHRYCVCGLVSAANGYRLATREDVERWRAEDPINRGTMETMKRTQWAEKDATRAAPQSNAVAALAAVRAACQHLRDNWIREADALDAVWEPRFGDGYPETDYAIEAKLRRQCAFQLAALAAAPPAEPPPDLVAQIESLALKYHKSPDGEGEYGCPGVTCPGVQRLIAFASSVAFATAKIGREP